MAVITTRAESCEGCGKCVQVCFSDIFEVKEGKAVVVGDQDKCYGCKVCLTVCKTGSITVTGV